MRESSQFYSWFASQFPHLIGTAISKEKFDKLLLTEQVQKVDFMTPLSTPALCAGKRLSVTIAGDVEAYCSHALNFAGLQAETARYLGQCKLDVAESGFRALEARRVEYEAKRQFRLIHNKKPAPRGAETVCQQYAALESERTEFSQQGELFQGNIWACVKSFKQAVATGALSLAGQNLPDISSTGNRLFNLVFTLNRIAKAAEDKRLSYKIEWARIAVPKPARQQGAISLSVAMLAFLIGRSSRQTIRLLNELAVKGYLLRMTPGGQSFQRAKNLPNFYMTNCPVFTEPSRIAVLLNGQLKALASPMIYRHGRSLDKALYMTDFSVKETFLRYNIAISRHSPLLILTPAHTGPPN